MSASGDLATLDLRREYMQRAIDDVMGHLNLGEGGPFGACVVRGTEIVAVAHNTVLKCVDPTCHAEVNAIRLASQRLKNFDLSGCVIYSTTEPCPMCFSAIHWARMDGIVFGTTIEDARELGFNELSLKNEVMVRLGGSPVAVRGNFMRDECLAVYDAWRATPGHRLY